MALCYLSVSYHRLSASNVHKTQNTRLSLDKHERRFGVANGRVLGRVTWVTSVPVFAHHLISLPHTQDCCCVSWLNHAPPRLKWSILMVEPPLNTTNTRLRIEKCTPLRSPTGNEFSSHTCTVACEGLRRHWNTAEDSVWCIILSKKNRLYLRRNKSNTFLTCMHVQLDS